MNEQLNGSAGQAFAGAIWLGVSLPPNPLELAIPTLGLQSEKRNPSYNNQSMNQSA